MRGDDVEYDDLASKVFAKVACEVIVREGAKSKLDAQGYADEVIRWTDAFMERMQHENGAPAKRRRA